METTKNKRGLGKRKTHTPKIAGRFINRSHCGLLTTFLLLFICLQFNAQSASKAELDLQNFKSNWMAKNQLQQLDDKQYAQMKAEWTKHLEQQTRAERAENGDPVDAERQQQFNNWQGKDFPSSFPKMVHTGDPEKDKAIYDANKQIWIDNNPELYKKMTSSKSTMTKQERAEREEIRKNQNK